LLDIISDPLKAAALKEMTGVDFLGAHNAQRQAMAEQRQQQEFDWRRYKDVHGGSPQNLPVPGQPGATYPAMVSTFGNVSPLGGITPPKLGNVNVTTPEGQFNQPINEYTGQPAGTPIKTGETKGESADVSARLALANQGLQHVNNFKSIVAPNGEVDRATIFTMNAPMGGIGKGREALVLFLDALDARSRAATGAAMPKEEIENYKRIYFPHPLDKDETVKNKMNRLEGFLNDYVKTLDPSGNMRKRLSNQKTAIPPQAAKQLKEGNLTKFGNGQVWTLKNGVPTRVE
jgi:hypothetical protein